MAQKMERGTEALKSHVSNLGSMDIRQTRRGWLQECLGCEAKTEFNYFVGENKETHIAHSLEDASFICRCCCSPCHPFVMEVKELNTEAELLTVDRPMQCPVGSCKCGCYQAATFTSGGQQVGAIKEDCYFCIPSFTTTNSKGEPEFIIHPATCCGGMCFNCCAEGNPCGRGCCKVPFHVFPYSQKGSTDGDAPFIGKILKKPKSAMTEMMTEANAFEVTFPEQAGAEQKAALIGSAIFLNANLFEGE